MSHPPFPVALKPMSNHSSTQQPQADDEFAPVRTGGGFAAPPSPRELALIPERSPNEIEAERRIREHRARRTERNRLIEAHIAEAGRSSGFKSAAIDPWEFRAANPYPAGAPGETAIRRD